FGRIHTQPTGRLAGARMLGVDVPLRNLAAFHRADERLQLVVLTGWNEGPLLFQLLLDGAEEEHPVLDDGPADRSTELLAAEGRLLAVGLLGEVVLRGDFPI